MNKVLETSKGRFVVKHYETWSELIIDVNYYKLKLGIDIFKLSKINELEASSIVDSDDDYGVVMYQNYRTTSMQYFDEQITAIQSLHSLLESKGIEITNNTYIFKV